MYVYKCNGTYIFMGWKMKCSIQRGEAELKNIHYLFYVTWTKNQILKQI